MMRPRNIKLPHMSWLSLALVFLLTFSMPGAQAATIDITTSAGGDTTISVSGEIFRGDDERFATIAANGTDDTTVLLDGPGGNLGTGLRIGSAIRMRAWKTAVSDGAVCASACGLIWLGGVQRNVGWQARIGFHAAWIAGPDGVKREVGSGNALVGSYLSRLGLTDNAVVYFTSAAPDEAAWLTEAVATQVGLRVTFAAQGASQQAAANAAPRSPTVSAGPSVPGKEVGVAALVSALYANFPRSVTVPKQETCVGRACKIRLVGKDGWTDKAGVEHQLIVAVAEVEGDCHACAAILGVGQFRRSSLSDGWQAEILTPAVTRVGGYGVFGGKARFVDGGVLGRVVVLEDGGGGQGVFSTDASLVLAVNAAFKEVLMVPLSLNVDGSCDDKEAECRKNMASSNYTSEFALATRDDSKLHVEQTFSAAFPIPAAHWTIDEKATVRQIAGGKASPGANAQDRASLESASFYQAHADRLAFDAWFAGLADDARLGAESWASRRSLRTPGNCEPPQGRSTQWSVGCTAARQKLGAFDARRKSEPDYRRGWNSL